MAEEYGGRDVSAPEWPPLCGDDERLKESGCIIRTHYSDYDELQYVHSTYPASVVTKHTATMSTTTVSLAGITTSSNVVVRKETLSEFSHSSGALIRQQEYIPGANDTFRVTVREYHADGTTEFREFDTPRIVYQAAPGLPFLPLPDNPIENLNCTADEFSILKDDLSSALNHGFWCMFNNKRSDIGFTALARYYRGETVLNCVFSGGGASMPL